MTGKTASRDLKTLKPRILLHVCCAPCATWPIERLRKDYDVTLFFSNSNVAPAAEYEKRLQNVRKLADRLALPLIADAYDHDRWREHVKGLENEPEKGRRCEKCFEFNLNRAADYGRNHGFELFTTSLTVSPHKSSATIFRIARGKGRFLECDFKKENGFKRSRELSRLYDLYRQDYCGCEFSASCSSTSTPFPPPAGPAR
jgi:hypothetical protein